MKTELKKDLQNAPKNRSRSGVGFQNLSDKRLELEEKLIAVRSEIMHTFENIQIPELTRKVKEVLALADEIDPENLYGSERRRKKYGPLNEYLHNWKRHKEVMTECPLSDDSEALLDFIPSLGEIYRKSDRFRDIRDEKGVRDVIELEEDEMTDEVKELNRGKNRLDINQYARSIETKALLFLYNNAIPLIKKAKKLGLPISYSFEFEIKTVFQDERKAYLSNRYKPQYRSPEERQLALFNILLSYLGHCQVANFLMNKVTEDLEFTKDLYDKAKAIYKESVDKFCKFLKDFSRNLRRKAESYLMLITNTEIEQGSKKSRDCQYMEGISLGKKQRLFFLELCHYSFRR